MTSSDPEDRDPAAPEVRTLTVVFLDDEPAKRRAAAFAFSDEALTEAFVPDVDDQYRWSFSAVDFGEGVTRMKAGLHPDVLLLDIGKNAVVGGFGGNLDAGVDIARLIRRGSLGNVPAFTPIVVYTQETSMTQEVTALLGLGVEEIQLGMTDLHVGLRTKCARAYERLQERLALAAAAGTEYTGGNVSPAYRSAVPKEFTRDGAALSDLFSEEHFRSTMDTARSAVTVSVANRVLKQVAEQAQVVLGRSLSEGEIQSARRQAVNEYENVIWGLIRSNYNPFAPKWDEVGNLRKAIKEIVGVDLVVAGGEEGARENVHGEDGEAWDPTYRASRLYQIATWLRIPEPPGFSTDTRWKHPERFAEDFLKSVLARGAAAS